MGFPGRGCSRPPWKCSGTVWMQHCGTWFVGMVRVGWGLDFMILEVFSKFNVSIIAGPLHPSEGTWLTVGFTEG